MCTHAARERTRVGDSAQMDRQANRDDTVREQERASERESENEYTLLYLACREGAEQEQEKGSARERESARKRAGESERVCV